MRILTLTNLYPNPFQPHRATFNRNQLRILGERHPVRVIAPIAWTDELKARRQGQPALPAGRRRIFDGLEVEHPRYLFAPKILRKTYGRSYLASVRAAFARAVDAFQPDLVYAPWAYPDGWAATELGRIHGLPVVIKVVGSDILLLDRHASRTGPTSEALRQADAVVAVSQDLSKRVVGLGVDPKRIRVVIDGVDKERFCPGDRAEAKARLGLDPDARIILSIGNLVPVKGQNVLIEAVARLLDDRFEPKDQTIACCLIGGGPLRADLARLASERNLGDRFRMPGAIPQDALPDWYRAADVFALPSHSEGIPNVLLEAAACGTPFVASQVGGIPEIEDIGPCRLVPPGDPEALASALREFLDQPSPASRVGGSGRAVAETVDDLERLFDEVLARRRRPAPLVSDDSRSPVSGWKVPS
jgi:glycosyltransferase involved in cell wall biosynthesis